MLSGNNTINTIVVKPMYPFTYVIIMVVYYSPYLSFCYKQLTQNLQDFLYMTKIIISSRFKEVRWAQEVRVR